MRQWCAIFALAVCGGAAVFPGAAPHGAGQTVERLPQQLRCRARETYVAHVRNGGRSVWPATSSLTLAADADAIALGSPAVVRRTGAGNVRPGGSASFRIHLEAPAAPSLLRPRWRFRFGARSTGGAVGGPVQIYCDAGSGIDRKLLAGYQGWFSCPNDGAPPGYWIHWFNGVVPDAQHAGFDLWPDTSTLSPAERCPTSMTLRDGSPAQLFSSANAATVERHAAWMEEYGIDGVVFQRFLTVIADPTLLRNRDIVLLNLLRAAERHGRRVMVSWDISGDTTGRIRQEIAADWRHMVDDLHVTSSPAYLYDHGRPLVEVWGFGFADRNGTVAQAAGVVNDFHHPSAPRLAARVVGGVPAEWRTMAGSPSWPIVYASFDVIHPWSVGVYDDDAGDDAYRRDVVAADLALTAARHQGYIPGVFPGFSWHNLFRNRGEDWPLNQIPRRGGRFLWHQGFNLVDAGAKTVFVAMFDEFDEGTAILPAVSTRAGLPTQGTFIALDADGETLPPDWYLRVTGEIGRMLRGERPVQPALPLSP